VIILDANVLLYAYDSSSAAHARCKDWLERALNGEAQVGIPWQTLLAFVRISTNPRAFRNPLTIAAAVELVETWMARPHVAVPAPGVRYWPMLKQQLMEAQVSGPLVTDAALAALALEHGAALATTDRDFRRFDELEVVNPAA
jgi:toxin-antitoxin system PIN domain toxin